MTTSLVGLSPWLCPASAPYFLPARVSKPALNAWQGRQNALWRGERERQVLEAGVSMQCNGKVYAGDKNSTRIMGIGLGS